MSTKTQKDDEVKKPEDAEVVEDPNTEDIEVDDEVVDAVADKAMERLQKSIPTADEIAEKLAAITEDTKKKNIHNDGELPKTQKTGFEAMSKEMRFAKAVLAKKNGDMTVLREYNAYADKAWSEVSKANYQNVTTAADGGALAPDPEFIAEVDRLTMEYGVVARLAQIRRTDRDSVTMLRGTNEISFVASGEAEAQNAQKLTYAAETKSL